MEACQHGGVRLAEALIVSFLAEDLVIFQESEDVVLVALGSLVEAVGHTVNDLDGLALLVDTFRVTRPRGNDSRRQRHLAVVLEVLAHDGEQPLGDAVGGLGAQASDGVLDGGVAEALDELVAVVVEIHARDRLQGRGALFLHVLEEEGGKALVVDNVVHEAVADEVAEVAQALVGGVEEAELGRQCFAVIHLFSEISVAVQDAIETSSFIISKYTTGSLPLIFDLLSR